MYLSSIFTKTIVVLHPDPYVAYRSPYGPAGSNDLSSGGGAGGVMGLSNSLATGE